MTDIFNEIRFCVKQYPTTSFKTTVCDFKGTIPTNANQFKDVRDATIIAKFDIQTTTLYVFVYLGRLKMISNLFIQMDTQSVQHYKGNFAFKINRSLIPKQSIHFNSVFHTEGGLHEDLEKVITFQKLWPAMFCPVEKETFCELSETCIDKSLPCKDKTGSTQVLKNLRKKDVISFGKTVMM